ncbi:hypothetical protein [Nonomuraea sp. KM90]|uniref:hypothetical protein n=1 Tax=Nonomuraea sp. KM90 TaxID=3457428 RepID=UPI003FCEC33B
MIAGALVLAGRAGAALLATIAIPLSRTSVLSALMALPEPPRESLSAIPPAIGVDDFATKRDQRYATIIMPSRIDA